MEREHRKDKAATGPVVIMQNGVGVERPFLEARFSPISRCILYVTSQAASEYDFTFRPITSSPRGSHRGHEGHTGIKQEKGRPTLAFPWLH